MRCSLLPLSSDFCQLPQLQQKYIYEEFYRFVYPYVYRSLKDHSASEDVIHDALLRTIDRMPPFPEEGRIRAWIRTTARNCTVNYLRKNARGLSQCASDTIAMHSEHACSISEDDVANQVELKILSEEIMAQLRLMKPESRLIFELRWRKSLSYKEIAERIRIPENTVRSKLFRAREWMKERLASP